MKKFQREKTIILVLGVIIVVEAILLGYFTLQRPKKRKLVTAPPPVVKMRGKIAIILDDWGYNLNNSDLIREMHYPLTMSVLPNLKFSKLSAKELHIMGFEVLMHLPMEPYEKSHLEKKTIMNTLSDGQIAEIIKKDLSTVPYCLGVSNHMGSAATENERTMEVIFRELKKRNLFYVDSFVSPKSVCAQVAQKLKVKFCRRDIFLDNQEDPAYIKRQVERLKTRAGIFGEAVGVGHNRRATLEVLKELMPQIEKEGFKFVFVSELVK